LICLNLAVELFYQKKIDDALVLFKRAELIQEKSFGSDNVRLAQTWRNIGVIHRTSKQFEAASTAYSKAIRLFEASSGADNPILSTWLQEYAEVLKKQQRFAEAEQAVTQALGIQVRNTLKAASLEKKDQVRMGKKPDNKS
jgi:tetratricopeptide (TPR) repeat protein